MVTTTIQDVKNQIVQGANEYFRDTTIHGLRYIIEGRNVYEKILWTLLVVTAFTKGGSIIVQTYITWDDEPLQTTIDKMAVPITELPFPAITICDQESLQMPRRNTWMFIEQLLNWVDVETIDTIVNDKNQMIQKRNIFGLPSIKRKINEMLQNHPPDALKWSEKKLLDHDLQIEDCLNLKETCATILEFLWQDKEQNIYSNTASLYSSVLKDWNDTYPTPTTTRIRLNQYNALKANVSKTNMRSLGKLKRDKFRSCNSTSGCIKATNEILVLWKQLSNLIGIVHEEGFYQIGKVVANFYMLLEMDWHGRRDGLLGEEMQVLHQQLKDIASTALPAIGKVDIALPNVLGLLGYVPTFDANMWRNGPTYFNDFSKVKAILEPLYGFNSLGKYVGLTREASTPESCNLLKLFSDWIGWANKLKNGNINKGIMIY